MSVKVDREERPDVDAVYMQATTAMTGHGGWPMTCVLDHEGAPFFAGTYFPDQPRHGQPAFRQVLQALSAGVDLPARGGAAGGRQHPRATCAAPSCPRARSRSTRRCSTRRWQTFGTEFDAANGGFGTAPKFPPSMVLEFLLRHAGRARRLRRASGMLDRTLDAMARGGLYDQLAGGFARYSVDRGWVVPHFEKMLYDNAQLVGLYARRRWRPRRTGSPARPPTSCSRELAHRTRVRSRPRWTPTAPTRAATAARARSTRGPRPSSRTVLGDDAALGGAAARRHATPGPSSRAPPRSSSAPTRTTRGAGPRCGSGCSTHAAGVPARPATTRWSRRGTGSPISGLVDAGLRLDAPEYVEAAVRCAYLWDVHWVPSTARAATAGCAGSPATASSARTPGCWRTTAASPRRTSTSRPRPPTRRWLERARTLLDVAVARFAAGDGGFFDTADDAEALVSRPRDPTDNASPSGLSSLVHALLGYAALTGSGEHRVAGGELR